MRILITGGAGFLGSYLCDKYVKDGHTVICFDNFLSGTLTNIKPLLNYRNFKNIKGDIQNYEQLEKQIVGCDAVFNLAAQIHVDRSYVEPKETYDINVMGTQNVLELSRIHDIPKVIHASSSEVYGTAQEAPMTETHPLCAPHPYGASKIAADRMCYTYAKTYGLNVSAPRMFNTFGPRQRSIGYGGVISIFTRRVLAGYPPIVFGNGKQTRDYTYITDMVEAYDTILKREKRIGPTNFGSGKEISIQDVAELIIKLCGKNLLPANIKPRMGEVDRLICDRSKAMADLRWWPKVTFEKGLGLFIDWFRKFGIE